MDRTVSLVLGSGGARGMAHIGVIREFEERGYRIASIAGCSVGAMVGGIHAAGKLDSFRDWVTAVHQGRYRQSAGSSPGRKTVSSRVTRSFRRSGNS